MILMGPFYSALRYIYIVRVKTHFINPSVVLLSSQRNWRTHFYEQFHPMCTEAEPRERTSIKADCKWFITQGVLRGGWWQKMSRNPAISISESCKRGAANNQANQCVKGSFLNCEMEPPNWPDKMKQPS
ncbi:hypothetical protein CDAR_492701 [Caerostris darwini]|uniref:Uncharacterized protein n=1 Tax=Caerostris darwini TaxID=1538125 RepID=A0AAV4UZJ0_9ARAC|nr:hypothetical protein CDAR_492701 [Caerostris darwini]